MSGLNQSLFYLAQQRIKSAFVPSDQAAQPPGGEDPSAGGAPPDASGGAPPDPSMTGPPPDAGTTEPPAAQGDIATQVAQGVSQALAQSGGMGGAGAAGGMKSVKPSIETMSVDLFQLKKMIFAVMQNQGIELPPDTLDGPNRDPQNGMPATGVGGGGSNVQPGASQQGQQGAIQPIQPMQPALDSGGAGGGGMGKTSSSEMPYTNTVGREYTAGQILSKAAAVAMMFKQRKRELV